jgi:ATP-dependent RNA helicase DDX31/DBP7
MGFEADVNAIIDALYKKHLQQILLQQSSTESPVQGGNKKEGSSSVQTVLVSATVDERVKKLALNLTNQQPYQHIHPTASTSDTTKQLPVNRPTKAATHTHLSTSNQINSSSPFDVPTQLVQYYVVVPCKQRLVALTALLRGKALNHSKLIVFMSSCDEVDFHYHLFQHSKANSTTNDNNDTGRLIPCEVFKLHGNMQQAERKSTYQRFSTSNEAVLLATDVGMCASVRKIA